MKCPTCHREVTPKRVTDTLSACPLCNVFIPKESMQESTFASFFPGMEEILKNKKGTK